MDKNSRISTQNSSATDEFEKTLDSQSSLLIKILDKEYLKGMDIKLRSLLFFLFIVLFNPFNVINVISYELSMSVSLSLIFLWIYWGVILLYKHHHEVYKKFWLRLFELIGSKSYKANEKIHKKSSIVSFIIVLAWTSALVIAIFKAANKLSFMGIREVSDVNFILLAIQTGLVAYLTSLGFVMAYKMLYTIYFISKNKDYNIPFDPLNNDELGNYSVIKDCKMNLHI